MLSSTVPLTPLQVESIPLHVHVTNEAIATSWALPPSALGLCGKGNYVFVLDVGGRTTDGALSRCAKGGLFIISYASTTAMSGTVVTEKLLKIARERLLQAGPALAIGRHLTAKEVNDAKKDLRPELEYYQISLRQFTGPLKEAVIQANKMSGAKQEDEDVDEPELCVPTSALWEQLNTVDGDATEMGSPISAIKDLLRNARRYVINLATPPCLSPEAACKPVPYLAPRSKVPAKCQLLVVGSGGALKTWNLQEELRAYCEELGNTRLTEGSMGAGSMVSLPVLLKSHLPLASITECMPHHTSARLNRSCLGSLTWPSASRWAGCPMKLSSGCSTMTSARTPPLTIGWTRTR